MKVFSTLRFYADQSFRIVAGLWKRPHPAPVFILGNQKGGTTIISWLLSEYTGLEIAPEIRTLTVEQAESLMNSPAEFPQLIQKNRADFSRPIIKDNHLSFLMPALRKNFPEGKLVLIVRDPRDNIRSILNRLKLPGNEKTLSESQLSAISPEWRKLLESENWGNEAGDYIGVLCARWNFLVERYLEEGEGITLIRYEDFLTDKVGTIEKLAAELNLKGIRSIKGKENTQKQVKGKREVNWEDFFGTDNFERINALCKEGMLALNYNPERKAFQKP